MSRYVLRPGADSAWLNAQSPGHLPGWFIEFDQARWDNKLEDASNAGKLEFLVIQLSTICNREERGTFET